MIRFRSTSMVSDAYNKAMKDPALLVEAKNTPLEINPTTGQELEALAKDVTAQPKELVGA